MRHGIDAHGSGTAEENQHDADKKLKASDKKFGLLHKEPARLTSSPVDFSYQKFAFDQWVMQHSAAADSHDRVFSIPHPRAAMWSRGGNGDGSGFLVQQDISMSKEGLYSDGRGIAAMAFCFVA